MDSTDLLEKFSGSPSGEEQQDWKGDGRAARSRNNKNSKRKSATSDNKNKSSGSSSSSNRVKKTRVENSGQSGSYLPSDSETGNSDRSSVRGDSSVSYRNEIDITSGIGYPDNNSTEHGNGAFITTTHEEMQIDSDDEDKDITKDQSQTDQGGDCDRVEKHNNDTQRTSSDLQQVLFNACYYDSQQSTQYDSKPSPDAIGSDNANAKHPGVQYSTADSRICDAGYPGTPSGPLFCTDMGGQRIFCEPYAREIAWYKTQIQNPSQEAKTVMAKYETLILRENIRPFPACIAYKFYVQKMKALAAL